MMKLSIFAPFCLALAGLVSSQTTNVGLSLLTTMTLPGVIEDSQIPIPSGFTQVVSYSNGTASGPGLNGTVKGATSRIARYPQPDGTFESRAEATIFGTTTDGEDFITTLSGVIGVTAGFSGGQIFIGGKYANLSNAYIFASQKVNPTAIVGVIDFYVPYLKS